MCPRNALLSLQLFLACYETIEVHIAQSDKTLAAGPHLTLDGEYPPEQLNDSEDKEEV